MKRFSLIALMIIMTIMVINTGDAKAKNTKKVVETDQTLIKKAVLVHYDAWLKHKKPTALTSAKFSPIRIKSNWAVTIYPYQLDDKGNEEVLDGRLTYILKKSKGKWLVKKTSDYDFIDVDQCKKIGLSFKTAKMLDVVTWWN